MSTPTDGLVTALERHGCQPRRSGSGWSARCPAHDDRQASLSVSEGDDGRCLVFCHAGCDTRAIVEAVGLSMRDLMSGDGDTTSRRPMKTGVSSPGPTRNGHASGKPAKPPNVYLTREVAAQALSRRLGQPSGRWTYHDAQGEPVGMVLRWERADGKTIRPLARVDGGWAIEAMPAPRPLYRLRELAAADVVFVVEGEKCADATWSIGLVATTSAGGAMVAGTTGWAPLAGKQVVILPDNDDAGRQYAADVAGLLAKLDPPAIVKVVELPGLEPGGDLADWLDTHDGAEPESLRQQIKALADAAAPFPRAWSDAEVIARLRDAEAKATRGGVVEAPAAELVSLASVEPEAVTWLWPQRIALGKLTTIAGDPGLGKSFLSLDLAARVSRGVPWPDGSGHAPLGSVVLLSAEDDLADTIRPRLDAAGADVARIHSLAAVCGVDQNGEYRRGFDLSRDVARLEEVIAELGDCRLVVFDPISTYLGRTKGNDNVEVRGVLAPLTELAGRLGVAVVAVSHLRKVEGPAMYRTMGSMAFVAAARAAYAVGKDKDDPTGQRRLMAPVKNNLGDDETGLAYRLTAAEPGGIPHVVWEPAPVSINADDALAWPQGRRGPKPEAAERAETFLRRALAEGPRPATKLIDEASDVYGISKRTLRRAHEALGVVAFREVVPGPWWWRLPDHDHQDGQETDAPSDTELLGHLGHLAKNKGETALSEAGEPKAAKLPEYGHLGPPEPRPDPRDEAADERGAAARSPDGSQDGSPDNPQGDSAQGGQDDTQDNPQDCGGGEGPAPDADRGDNNRQGCGPWAPADPNRLLAEAAADWECEAAHDAA